MAGAVFAILGMALLSGRLLADHLFLGLSGSPAFYFGGMALYALAVLMVPFVLELLSKNRELANTVQDRLVWAASAVIILKLLAAVWLYRALLRRGLVSPRALARYLAIWALAVICVFLLAHGLLPKFDRQYDYVPVDLPIIVQPIQRLLPRTGVPVAWIVCGAILAVPLVRLAAAPLALEWNRHR